MDVSSFNYHACNLQKRFPKLFSTIAGFENSFYQDKLDGITIEKPIFVTGLARSGTTILLEKLATHPDCGSNTYRDFPFLSCMMTWNGFLDLATHQNQAPKERAHKDRIMITPTSPEALEEPLWTQFFPRAHLTNQSNVLDATTSCPAFEKAYKRHIQKTLLLRKKSRYLSKGNYNVTRIAYLQSLFPESRFVIPIRQPSEHLASLLKQHRLFSKEEQENPRILSIMEAMGHYEFGLNLSLINTNENTDMISLTQDAKKGSVEAWAVYWNLIHRYILTLATHNLYGKSILLVSYDELCAHPEETLSSLFNHCHLSLGKEHISNLAKDLSKPSYYSNPFSEQEMEMIQSKTQETYQALIKQSEAQS